MGGDFKKHLMNTQLRIEGSKERLQFADKKELEAYLRNILAEVSPESQKKVDHLPLVEFYGETGSVVIKDFSELPNKDITVNKEVLVKIYGKKRNKQRKASN